MGLLTSIREEWATNLTTHEASGAKAFFTPDAPLLPIPVITEKLGTIEQRINDGLTKTGLSVLIATVVAKGGRNQIPGRLSLANIIAAARVFEDPKSNQTGISASDCAEAIYWFTKQFKTAGGSPFSFVSIGLGKDPTRVCYDVVYSIDGDTSTRPSRT